MATYKLSDTFEIRGQWWLPGNEANKVGGVLKYTPHSISLDLMGVLSVPSWVETGEMPMVGEKLPLIYGETSEGKCTLFECYLVSLSHDSTLDVRLFIVSCHARSLDDLGVKEVWFDCTHLTEFISARSFEVQHRKIDEGRPETKIRCVSPSAITWTLAEADAILSLEPNQHITERSNKVSVEIEYDLVFRSNQPQTLRWYLGKIAHWCQLLTLLTDENVRPGRVRVVLDVDEYRHAVFYTRTGHESARKPPATLLFYLAHLVDSFGNIADAWITADRALKDAIGLFMDGHEHDSNLDKRFSALAQSIEVFSRATTESLYMTPDEYESVRQILNNAIPSPPVSKDHRRSLESRIEFGNEYSLRKRIRNLLKSLSDEASDCVCRSKSAFENGMVDTRNYLTHYTDKLRPQALSNADLYASSAEFVGEIWVR